VANLVINRQDCRALAESIGPATEELVGDLLDSRPVDKLRQAGRMLRLADVE
jgi:hypothetical protein